MSFEYRPQDLDTLIASIESAVSSVRAEYGTRDVDINAIISIAETVKQHAVSAKSGVVREAALLQNLFHQCSDIFPKSSECTDSAITQFLSQPSASFNHALNGCIQAVVPSGYSVRPKSVPVQKPPKLKTTDGKLISLGKCLGQGGEGSVYKIPDSPGKVAKVYHRQHLADPSRGNIEKKIRFLAKKKDAAYIGDTLVAALPEEPLYFSDGSFAGYTMPQFATSAKLYDVQREGLRRSLLPELDYRGLIVIAYNLAEAVNHLHSHGIIVGDMNPNNIVVHADGTIGLIDCDSFDITNPDTGEHFPCCVGLPELLAPELQAVNKLYDAPFSKNSDMFSMAIHIFRLLMNNADPFCFSLTSDKQMLSLSAVESDNPIINGESVYFQDIPGKEIPSWSPDLTVLPTELQALFRRTFAYTSQTAASKIVQRPTATEWMNALQKFYQLPLTQCKKDGFHWFMPHLLECPFCPKQNDFVP